MTIDEAIKHCLEVAKGKECKAKHYNRNAEREYNAEKSKYNIEKAEESLQCAADHRQLAEWLTELQELKLQIKAPRLGIIEEYHYELAKCKAAFWNCNRKCMDAEEQYRRKADELRKAQEQIAEYKRLLKAVKWISVKDRLPEERKRVLVYNEGGITIAWRDKGEWDDIFLTVTHWQPLPEPPKEGDTNG